MSGVDFHFLGVGTSDAASAPTYLRVINDVHESPHHEDAMKYLKRVQAEATGKDFISFVGALKEFHEDVSREINVKEYVTKCAVALFQGHTDLILALGDYIPEIRDTLDLDRPHEVAQKRRQDFNGDAIEWQQECLLNQTASDSENDPNVEPDRQTATSLRSQQEHVPSDAAIENLMINVQKRIRHADQTTYMKISRILNAFLVDAAMPPRIAKAQIAALVHGHNNLWKEFERFLPPGSRAGSSSRAKTPNPR